MKAKDSIFIKTLLFYAAVAIITLFVAGMVIKIFFDKDKDQTNTTELVIYNHSSTDTVTVYLTLSPVNSKYVNDVNGLFGIKSDKKLQGSFTLYPKERVSYTSPAKKALSGNISFNKAPDNCPYPAPNLFEFTLNNYKTVKYAQETVDISCIYGVNTYGSISMSGGGKWSDNVENFDVKQIVNKNIYHNTGISGVFPYGCTNCTNTDGVANCDNREPYADPNSNNICNVQRPANNNGGSVTIHYIGAVK